MSQVIELNPGWYSSMIERNHFSFFIFHFVI